MEVKFEYLRSCTRDISWSMDSTIWLFMLYNKQFNDAEALFPELTANFESNIKYLESQGYLKIVGDLPEGIEWRKKYLDLLPTESNQSTSVEEWINDWRELWPSGVKSGGYYIKSNKEDLLNKMNKFVKKYKFTKEQIFEATKNYLTEQKNKGWAYTKLANYFIDKDNISILASYCANIGSKVENKSINTML